MSWLFVLGLFVSFGLFSVLLWAFFRFQPAEELERGDGSDAEDGLAEHDQDDAEEDELA